LALTSVTMYTYIMQRTQIYLSERETDALDVAVRATGKTRSHLIREAIAERYGATADADAIETRLRETAGAWAGRRRSGQATVERLRGGRLARLHESRTREPSKPEAT
jgi:predicted DNA-binding protein